MDILDPSAAAAAAATLGIVHKSRDGIFAYFRIPPPPLVMFRDFSADPPPFPPCDCPYYIETISY